MFEEFQICPYTGLRSFTEEESIYFKGRDENIEQAIEQLQRNKFLMLTGASGDGKSSLVYAGIIPNARAGFLKSKYSQWAVADFRPERSPYKNLCRSLAAQLGIESVQTVESELKHGFSALIELYRNSDLHLDTGSLEWKQADDQGKATLKRKSANLLILADQFEEFFTNPENYHRGAPSRESNLVLNLLLETARIALEEDLPIYIVFTMRSDFIGQCAAFRGLPEYIGFSQFFVPRLNRSQLQQVIEEPAKLSGNRISRRLSERLIHDLTEGGDQLPILQHALSQIWHAADEGKEEMDLIHYAKVGGMPVEELPDEQIPMCKQWFENLSDEVRACYHEPGLQNVLDTHTNKLFSQAPEYFENKTGNSISSEDASFIMKTAFTCLTKIDQSRAVRNRMTLSEITNIINHPELDSKTVGTVLKIFREPGNTFIRPFIFADDEQTELKEDDVLDITHESLIRNWRMLAEWADEEFENHLISLDFGKQLNRWLESDKSNNFLLSIGPLTYFENWYEKVNPNAYWIARYLPEDLDKKKKLEKSKKILADSREFLKLSAKKHMVTRTVMHYGPKRIAAVIGVFALVFLMAFTAMDYMQKQNDYVLESIKNETLDLANRSDLAIQFIVPLITEQMIAGNITTPEVVDGIDNPAQKIKIVTGIASQLVLQGRYEPKDEILLSLHLADSLLNGLDPSGLNAKALSESLQLINDYSATAGLAHYYNPSPDLHEFVISNAGRTAEWATFIFEKQPAGFTDIQNLNTALENALNHRMFTQDEIKNLLGNISPFENASLSGWLKDNYRRDRILFRGAQATYGHRFNGLYQELAYLYAAVGKPEMALQSLDSLLQNQNTYFQNDYATHIENASNVAAVFYMYGHQDKLDSFVSGYTARKSTGAVDFYNRLVSRMMLDLRVSNHLNYYTGFDRVYSNLNLKFSSNEMVSFFFSKMREVIGKESNADSRNFNLAVSYKNEGILLAFRKEIRPDGLADLNLDNHFQNAFNYYKEVSGNYLNQPINTISTSGADNITVPRKFLFQYPDYRVSFHPFEPRDIVVSYNSPSFIEYLIANDLFDRVYTDRESLRYFELWLLDYNIAMSSRDILMKDPIEQGILESIAEELENIGADGFADINILYLHLSRNAFEQDEPRKGIAFLKKINSGRLLNAFQYNNFFFANSYSLEMVGDAVANLTVNGEFELAYDFVNVFRNEVNRSSIYAYASQLVSLDEHSQEYAVQLLDSAVVEMNRLKNSSAFQPNRLNTAIAMMYVTPQINEEEAYKVIKNSPEKFESLQRFSLAYAKDGDLYNGLVQIPDLVSSSDRVAFYGRIIEGHNLRIEYGPDWNKFKNNEFIFIRRFLPYINESL